MPLDWSDLKLNGLPALFRALENLDKREGNLTALHNHLSYQLGKLQTSHQSLLDQLSNLTDLSTRLADLEYLISEELLLGLVQPAQIQDVVAELGNGWRIERQPAKPNVSAATSAPPPANPAATTTSNSCLLDDWVTQYTTAMDGE
jgi:hypothetical protein